MKKYIIGILLAVILVSAAACEKEATYTQAQVDQALIDQDAKSRAEGISSVDITSDNVAVVEAAQPELTAKINELQADIAILKEANANLTAKVIISGGSVVDSSDSDTVVTTTGGYNLDNIKLNVGIDKDLDDGEIDKFIDGKISFTNEDGTKEYDVSEHFTINKEAMIISSENKSKNEENPYFILPKNSLIYKYQFDKDIDVSTITSEYPLNIKFLGKDIKLIDVEDGEMIVMVASDYFLEQGQSVTINEKTIKLLRVGSAGAVVVDVDGVMETIPSGATETVNGIEITNDEVFFSTDSNTDNPNAATLYIGDDVKKNIDNGDFYTNDEIWKYNIDTSKDRLVISLTLNEKHTKVEADFEPLGLGDSIELAESYLTMTFSKIDADYTTYELDIEDGNCYKLSTSDEDINDEFKKVFIENIIGGKIYKEDDCLPGEDNINLIGTEVTLGDSGITIDSNLILSTGLDFFNG